VILVSGHFAALKKAGNAMTPIPGYQQPGADLVNAGSLVVSERKLDFARAPTLARAITGEIRPLFPVDQLGETTFTGAATLPAGPGTPIMKFGGYEPTGS
jgi:hypothetical protein